MYVIIENLYIIYEILINEIQYQYRERATYIYQLWEFSMSLLMYRI